MIARPGVVVRFSDNQQLLAPGDFTGHLFVGGRNLIEHRRPVCTSMWPGQLDAPLWLPFCWQAPSG